MPMDFWNDVPQYTQAQVRRIRAEITTLLKAKGLREGEGKWSTVFARHLRKRGL